MIEVQVFARLSNAYVVVYGGAKYLLNDWDIFFDGGKAYTYGSKLTQRYN